MVLCGRNVIKRKAQLLTIPFARLVIKTSSVTLAYTANLAKWTPQLPEKVSLLRRNCKIPIISLPENKPSPPEYTPPPNLILKKALRL